MWVMISLRGEASFPFPPRSGEGGQGVRSNGAFCPPIMGNPRVKSCGCGQARLCGLGTVAIGQFGYGLGARKASGRFWSLWRARITRMAILLQPSCNYPESLASPQSWYPTLSVMGRRGSTGFAKPPFRVSRSVPQVGVPFSVMNHCGEQRCRISAS